MSVFTHSFRLAFTTVRAFVARDRPLEGQGNLLLLYADLQVCTVLPHCIAGCRPPDGPDPSGIGIDSIQSANRTGWALPGARTAPKFWMF
jgi:hypothetical protein